MSNQWIWLVVWNIFYFSIYWEQSSQLTNSYFSEGLKPPTSGWNAVSAVSGDEVWYVRAAAASCTVGGILRHFLQYPATLPLPNRCRWWRGFRYAVKSLSVWLRKWGYNSNSLGLSSFFLWRLGSFSVLGASQTCYKGSTPKQWGIMELNWCHTRVFLKIQGNPNQRD